MSRARARLLSAGAVVVRPTADGPRLLLLRAWRNWDFPKGKVEAGETPFSAALREVKEEPGLTHLDFPWGEDYLETAPYARGKIARYYLALSPQGAVHLPVSPELGRPEHHEWRWVSFDEAAKLLPPRLLPILAWARRRVLGEPL